MIKNEIAKFKSELKKLSRNELARLATEFYMNWVLLQHQMEEILKKQESEKAEQKESV